MYEKFLKIKEEKSWLFYLLIIPFIVVAALEFYNRYLVNSGKKIVEKAEEKDKELEKGQIRAEEGAKFHEEEAKKAEKEREDNKVDEDWHLK